MYITLLTDRCGRYVANVVIGKLDSTGPGKPHLVVSKMLEATNSSTIAIVVRDALLQTFDEEQAVTITEASAVISCSSVSADLAYVFLLLTVTVVMAIDPPGKQKRGLTDLGYGSSYSAPVSYHYSAPLGYSTGYEASPLPAPRVPITRLLYSPPLPRVVYLPPSARVIYRTPTVTYARFQYW
uniref:(California timema) hypothetical protein n=1 Tax=Timema californicum TaxID=61474 RepID=A0A7R9PBC7_TIMCA|nr:unnamed protein product [Timema californicum]